MLRIETVSCGSKHLDETVKALAPQDKRDIHLTFDAEFGLDVEVIDLTIEEEADEHVILRTNNKDGYELKENQYFAPSRSPTGPRYEVRERVLGMTYVEADFSMNLQHAAVVDTHVHANDGQLDVIINDHVVTLDNALIDQLSYHREEYGVRMTVEWACAGEAR